MEALKACGGIVNLQVATPSSPVLFSVDSYQIALMPIAMPELAKTEATSQDKAVTETAEEVTEAEEPITEEEREAVAVG